VVGAGLEKSAFGFGRNPRLVFGTSGRSLFKRQNGTVTRATVISAPLFPSSLLARQVGRGLTSTDLALKMTGPVAVLDVVKLAAVDRPDGSALLEGTSR
jgi:hypothetical protein